MYCMLIYPKQTLGIIPFQIPCQHFAPPQNLKLSLIIISHVEKQCYSTLYWTREKPLLSKHITLQTDSLLMQAIMMHCSTCPTCDGLNCTREHVIGRHR